MSSSEGSAVEFGYDEVERIRGRWLGGRPRPEQNPSWWHSHQDAGVLLGEVDRLRESYDAMHRELTLEIERLRAVLEQITRIVTPFDGVLAVRIAREALGGKEGEVEPFKVTGPEYCATAEEMELIGRKMSERVEGEEQEEE